MEDNTEDNGYREGDSESLLEKQKAAKKQETDENILTAFMVVVFKDGRTEVATDIPQMKMQKKSELRDIRDGLRSAYDSINLMMFAETTAKLVESKLMLSASRIMEQQQMKSVIADPKGHFLNKK